MGGYKEYDQHLNFCILNKLICPNQSRSNKWQEKTWTHSNTRLSFFLVFVFLLSLLTLKQKTKTSTIQLTVSGSKKKNSLSRIREKLPTSCDHHSYTLLLVWQTNEGEQINKQTNRLCALLLFQYTRHGL